MMNMEHERTAMPAASTVEPLSADPEPEDLDDGADKLVRPESSQEAIEHGVRGRAEQAQGRCLLHLRERLSCPLPD
jgi:hypothetical protein